MLHMPQRSVTRFFIPLIDVLILLFCLYLLMPMVADTDASSAEERRRILDDQLRAHESEKREKEKKGEEITDQLRAEIERLRKERGEALQKRLAVRVLEIGKTGKLYYRDPDLVEIRNQADATALIERDRRDLGTRELYYLILYPRTRSAYPTREQLENYRRWFAGVALGYDRPGARPGGTQP
jgi:hypothetical protein